MPMIADKLRPLLALAGLLVLAALVYWPGLNGPFVLDDWQNIVTVHLEHYDWDGFVFTVTHNTSGMLGRIVSICSFVLSGMQYGLDPRGYKFHNLLLHLCTALLLARLAWQSLRLLAPQTDPQRHQWAALIVTGFWLLHPLQVSTVLYVVQRMSMLAAFFTLAGLLCYLAVRRQATASPRFWLLAFVLYPLLQALAVFSKETGALLPLYILLFEVIAFGTLAAPRALPRHQQLFLAVFVLVPLAVGGLYLLTHVGQLANYSLRNFTLAERLLTQLHVVPTYLRLILLPRVRDMSLYHDDFPLTTAADPLTLGLLVLLLAMAASVWLLRRRAPVLAFGIGWFLVSHLLESTIIPLELMFEHRNYLAMAGLLLPLVHHVLAYRERKLALAGIGLFFVLFLAQTFTRVQEWSNETLLFTQAVTDHPGSSRARTGMANLLTIQGKFQEAREQLAQAQAIDPRDAGPLLHELYLLCAQGVRSQEVIDTAVTTLAAWPASVYALNSLEQLYRVIQRQQCPLLQPDDMERLLAAARGQAGNTENKQVFGYLWRLQGFQDFLAGRYDDAVAAMQTAYEYNRDIVILTELAESQLGADRLPDAEATLAQMREIDRQHHGLEAFQVARLERAIEAAREGGAAATAPQ